MKTCKEVYDILHNKKAIVAIDAPSDLCKPQNERRQCEVALGIGGYFKTPKKRKLAEPWMQSGFDLWNFLQNRGYRKAASKPTKKGDLIEVHPTAAFKKVKSPKVESKLWISQKEPISKSKSKGKNQRRTILKGKFPKQSGKIDKLNIDYLDALRVRSPHLTR